jgi:hypothetical protein
VKRCLQLVQVRRRRSASSVDRVSWTVDSSLPQNGHFTKK